jgi:hypothetical protein
VRLAMTILVRDAEDLIETNLRYHRAQGVDLFLIGDNGSTDRTLEILEPYREAGLVELDHIEGDPRHVVSHINIYEPTKKRCISYGVMFV